MEQSDYLLRQIEMMARALAALIRKLTGLKEEGSEEELHRDTNEVLKEQLDIRLDDIRKVPLEKIASWILAKKGMNRTNTELMAEVLMLNASVISDEKERSRLLQAALALYSWADKEDNTYSLERHKKMNEIKTMLYG